MARNVAKVVIGSIHLLMANEVKMYSFEGKIARFLSSFEYLSHRCFIFAKTVMKINQVPSSVLV